MEHLINIEAGDAKFPYVYEREPEVRAGMTRRFGLAIPAAPVVRAFKDHELISSMYVRPVYDGVRYVRLRSAVRVHVGVSTLPDDYRPWREWLVSQVAMLDATNVGRDTIFETHALKVWVEPAETTVRGRGTFLIPILKRIAIVR